MPVDSANRLGQPTGPVNWTDRLNRRPFQPPGADHVSNRFLSALADTRLRDASAAVQLFVFDFDGVFTDNAVYVFEDGREAVRCSRADGIGLRKLEALEITPMIVSTEPNPVVAARSRKLAISCHHGVNDKLTLVRELLAQRGLELANCAYLGNDVNDAECLEHCGLPMVVRDAHPDVLGLGLYRTEALGGHGAVREVCDLMTALRASAPDGD